MTTSRWRTRAGLGLIALFCAASALGAQNAAPAAAPPQEAPDPLKFTQEFVLVFNQVKPDKTMDFESSWATIKAGLAKSDKPELKELGESIKIYKLDSPPAPGTPIMYVFSLNPPSKTLSYDPTKILYMSGGFERAEADAIYGRLKECYAGGINTMPLVKVGG